MISEVKPSAITIPSEGARELMVILTGIFVTVALLVAFVQPTPQWARHAPSLAVYLAVVAAVSAWLLYWGWRAGVRFDDHGLTIRYVFGTRQLGWREVSHFTDGCCKAGIGDGARRRSPVVLGGIPRLVDGQTIWLVADCH